MHIKAILKKLFSIGYSADKKIPAQESLPIPAQESLPQNQNLPKNESGETYGSGDLTPYERKPDLIKAMGMDGTIGYIRRAEADGPMPNTPEEALAIQAKQTNPRYINLYESNGKTIIGKFKISTGGRSDMPSK